MVLGLDTGYYRDGWLYSDNPRSAHSPQTLNKDLRVIVEQDLEGCDAVAHLAELSNDPLGENKPEVTLPDQPQGVGISRRESAGRRHPALRLYVLLQRLRRGYRGLPRRNVCHESADCLCGMQDARGTRRWRDGRGTTFCPVFLRNATAYGPSPRMRFDIVLNDLSALAWTTKRIAMISDGSPWRPLVHVEDICEAIYRSLSHRRKRCAARYSTSARTPTTTGSARLPQIVAEEFPGCEVTVGPASGDNRSYRVNFDRIHRELPGFACRYTTARRRTAVARGIRADPDDAGDLPVPRVHPA